MRRQGGREEGIGTDGGSQWLWRCERAEILSSSRHRRDGGLRGMEEGSAGGRESWIGGLEDSEGRVTRSSERTNHEWRDEETLEGPYVLSEWRRAKSNRQRTYPTAGRINLTRDGGRAANPQTTRVLIVILRFIIVRSSFMIRGTRVRCIAQHNRHLDLNICKKTFSRCFIFRLFLILD